MAVVRGGKRVRRNIKMAGDVVVLTVPKNKIRYFDSDTVSCLSNLARLTWQQKQRIDTSLDPDAFNTRKTIRRLLHFIRQEKHQFEADIVPSDLDAVLLVKPKLNNRRILAQNGAFFIFGQTMEITEPNLLDIGVERIRVPADAKKRIRDELDKLNINEKTLFPEIERAAKYLAESLQKALVSTILTKP
jgi:hypothetical protein